MPSLSTSDTSLPSRSSCSIVRPSHRLAACEGCEYPITAWQASHPRHRIILELFVRRIKPTFRVSESEIEYAQSSCMRMAWRKDEENLIAWADGGWYRFSKLVEEREQRQLSEHGGIGYARRAAPRVAALAISRRRSALPRSPACNPMRTRVVAPSSRCE